MKKYLYVCMVLMVMLLGFMGCWTNPTTGKWEIKPPAAAKIDPITESAEEIWPELTALAGVVCPSLAGILGIVGIGLGAWNKKKASNSYGVTTSVVTALEQWKEEHPEEWITLEAKLSKTIGTNAENIIRAIRGLPPKV